MDRRQFLVGVGRAGLAAGIPAAIDACTGPVTTGLLGVLGNRPTSPPSAPTPSAPPPSSRPLQPTRDNPVAAANRRPGNRGWDLRSAVGPSTATAFTAPAS